MLDSGSCVSVITNRYRNKLHLPLEPYKDSTVRLANGQRQTVLGATMLTVTLGNTSFDYKFIVLPFMNQSVLIGMDFLTACGAVMNCAQRIITFFDETIHLQFMSRPQLPDSTIMLINDCVIPANTEIVTNVRCRKTFTGLGLIKPTITTHNHNFMVARSLVEPRLGRAVCRLINPTEQPIHLHNGQVIANIEHIDKSAIITQSTIDAQATNQPRDLAKDTATIKELGITIDDTNLTPEQKTQLIHLLARNRDVFAKDLTELSCTNVLKHRIDTGDATPTRQRYYQQSPEAKREIEKQISGMLKNGIIEPTDSEWASSVLLVKKKSGELRFVVDYRRLNSVTRPLFYPLPLMSTVIETLGEVKPKYFSALDMRSGYWQLELTDDSKPKTAFACHMGMYQFTRLPFGISNAPSTYQLLMNKVFAGLIPSKLLVYIDDTILYANTFEAMSQNLEEVFSRLRAAKLKLHGGKSFFCQSRVTYLGHVLSADGVAVDPTKMDAFRTYPEPTNVKEVRAYLGYTGFYRKFVEGYAKIAGPLYDLLRLDAKFQWTPECQQAFDILKEKMLTSPILAFPDPTRSFILTTDASGKALGWVLSQKGDDGIERICSCNGRALRANELAYSAVEAEALALCSAVKEYHSLLSIMPFTVYTDNLSNTYIHSLKSKNARLLRYSLLLQTYKFQIFHKKGKLNSNADSLSRRPYPDPGPEDPNDDTVNDDVYFSAVDDLTISAAHDGNHQTEPTSPDEYTAYEFHFDTPTDDVPNKYMLNDTTPGVISNLVNDEQSNMEPHGTQSAPANTNPPSNTDDKFPPHETISVDDTLAHFTNDVPKLIELQQRDPELKRLLDFLDDGSLPGEPKLARKVVYESDQYFQREDGVLMHRYMPNDSFLKQIKPVIEQIVIPQSLQKSILQQFHDNTGHPGFDRTFCLLRQNCFFRQMYTAVRQYVKTCPICQRAKIEYNTKAAPLQPLPVVGLFERWHVDLMGPLRTSEPEGYKHLLVMVDSLSRWPIAVPLKTQEAAEVADAMWLHCFSIFGRPKVLLSDMGRNLMGNIVTALSKLFDVARVTSCGYRPQTNGACERMNEIYSKTLRCYTTKQVDWPQYIPAINAAFRATPAISSTQFSPYMLAFGFDMPLDVTRAYELQSTTPPHKNADDYIAKFLPRLKAMREVAMASAAHHQQLYKEKYDSRAMPKDWPVGTKVLIHNPATPAGLTPKLHRRYGDVWYIVGRDGPTNYILKHAETHKQLEHPIHVQRLRLYHDDRARFQPKDEMSNVKEASTNNSPETDQHSGSPVQASTETTTAGTQQPQAEPVNDNTSFRTSPQSTTSASRAPAAEGNESEWHAAKQLLSVRIQNGVRQYRVDWIGYPPTWENEDNISSFLKQDFHKKHTLDGKVRKQYIRRRHAGKRY